MGGLVHDTFVLRVSLLSKEYRLIRQALTVLLGFTVAINELHSSPAVAQTVTAESMLPVHVAAAERYRLFADATRSEQLTLNPQPLFVWSNPRRARGQIGHLFVWMNHDCPGAVATIFSFPWQSDATKQRIVHELHSLLESTLVSDNDSVVQPWVPTGGIDLVELLGAGEIPTNATRRAFAMRQLSRRLEAHTLDQEHTRWPLRVLPKELLSYESDDCSGTMFAMLGDVGSDPELLLLIEARKATTAKPETEETTDKWRWRLAPIRMTDQEIVVRFDGQPLWESVHDATNTRFNNKKRTYFRFQDAMVDASAISPQAN